MGDFSRSSLFRSVVQRYWAVQIWHRRQCPSSYHRVGPCLVSLPVPPSASHETLHWPGTLTTLCLSLSPSLTEFKVNRDWLYRFGPGDNFCNCITEWVCTSASIFASAATNPFRNWAAYHVLARCNDGLRRSG